MSEPSPVLVFAGDSVTDANHRDPGRHPLGAGYVRVIDDRLQRAGSAFSIVNAGIGGNRVRDVRARWAEDVLAHDPAVITILVGVNDMWRRFDRDDPTSAASFEDDYRRILDDSVPTGASLVMMEPFLLPIDSAQENWRDDLDEKIAVVHRLSHEYSARLVELDRHLTRRAAESDPSDFVTDGIHPTEVGHREIAESWLEGFRAP
ncbi:SGNH/GDSL hydrolase family protein [Herbiconiux ginsengi]|uniref:Lysophospholipase L1 n=1 Tax=Herbiconiux ginsengi TaxID=381665 RepID=A0A1H3LJN1_9MICO|nr:SGNH/GDSL hydrolase family protein [Herbiconiux ginsengi]SDY64055.1 Lysophospholipase L1 [Herbiconiux ginsengi]